MVNNSKPIVTINQLQKMKVLETAVAEITSSTEMLCILRSLLTVGSQWHTCEKFESQIIQVTLIDLHNHHWLHQRLSLCHPANLCYCYWQLCTKLDAHDHTYKKSLSKCKISWVFPDFSRIKNPSFLQFSSFTRVASILQTLAFEFWLSSHIPQNSPLNWRINVKWFTRRQHQYME